MAYASFPLPWSFGSRPGSPKKSRSEITDICKAPQQTEAYTIDTMTFCEGFVGLCVAAPGISLLKCGTPGKIRTYDLLLRRRVNRIQSFLQSYPVTWFFNNMGSLLSLSRQTEWVEQKGF
jgi:hypothetical protein